MKASPSGDRNGFFKHRVFARPPATASLKKRFPCPHAYGKQVNPENAVHQAGCPQAAKEFNSKKDATAEYCAQSGNFGTDLGKHGEVIRASHRMAPRLARPDN